MTSKPNFRQLSSVKKWATGCRNLTYTQKNKVPILSTISRTNFLFGDYGRLNISTSVLMQFCRNDTNVSVETLLGVALKEVIRKISRAPCDSSMASPRVADRGYTLSRYRTCCISSHGQPTRSGPPAAVGRGPTIPSLRLELSSSVMKCYSRQGLRNGIS